MTEQYPKALYGPRGWEDLDDSVTVKDATEEQDARQKGYKPLDEPEAPTPAKKRK